MASFNATIDRYKAVLANVDAGGPELPNENFDPPEQPSPASTREPTKLTPSCWGNSRTVSSRECNLTFARIF